MMESCIRWAKHSIYAAGGPGPRPGFYAAAPGTVGRMIGYFIDDAEVYFHLQLPGKGIECDAISNRFRC